LQQYQASEEFRGLAPRSRADYVGKIKLIEKTFAEFPLSAMSDVRTRGILKEWRERLAVASRRQADYAWVVLARVLSWGMDRGLIAANPCARGGRLYRGSRAEKIWTAADEAAFLERAPAHLHLALTLALWTGQRQGDLLRLPWSAYDGKHIRLQQSKGGVRVVIRVGAPLKAALEVTPKRSTVVASIRPQSELEALLAVQVAAMGFAALKFLKHSQHHLDETFIGVYGGYGTRLLRLQLELIQALDKHRRGNKQTVEVRHVHIYSGWGIGPKEEI
jgi:integrase